MNSELGLREKWAFTTVLAAVALLTAADLLVDSRAGTSWQHVLVELLVIGVSTAGIVLLWLRTVLRLRRRIRQSERDLVSQREEAQRWQREAAQHVAGLSRAIDAQMIAWGLTQSEQEVARLLLKGLSLKEIATVRGVAEKTIRHQSLAVYRKSGLSGRADLAAFFLEDLLAPAAPPSPGRAAEP